MKVSYKRDMTHNYLILEPQKEISGEEYQIRMLEKNQIPGFLRCSLKKIDGQMYFYYEVTSKQPLIHSFEKDGMNIEDIIRLMTGIKGCFEQASIYLLEPGSILLLPEYIYTDVETEEVFLCCLPGYDGVITQTFRELSEYILKSLNHNDTRAVAVGYEIYRRSAQENYSILQVIQSVHQIKGNGEGEKSALKREEGFNGMYFSDEEESNGKSINKNEHMYPDNNEGTQDTVRKIKPAIKNKEKESKIDKKKFESRKLLLLAIGIGSLLTGITAGISVLFRFSLTQTGGIFFLVVGVYAYIVTFIRKRKAFKFPGNMSSRQQKKAETFKSDWIEEYAEEETVDDLGETSVFSENVIGKGELFGETTILNDDSDYILSLISLNPGARGNIILSRDSLLIGKVKSKVDVTIELPVISRIHARIFKEENYYYVEDLNSRNGTYLNGERLEANERRSIQPSDELSFAGANYYVGRVT